jgi:hypothetical protein
MLQQIDYTNNDLRRSGNNQLQQRTEQAYYINRILATILPARIYRSVYQAYVVEEIFPLIYAGFGCTAFQSHQSARLLGVAIGSRVYFPVP